MMTSLDSIQDRLVEKWRIIILTDERLENLKDSLPVENEQSKSEVISICRLNTDDIIKHVDELKVQSQYKDYNILLVLNVGLHHIVQFKTESLCLGHTPLEIIFPTTKVQGITINKLSMNVINRLKNLRNSLKASNNHKVAIAFMPVFPIDIIKYQEFHVNLHYYKTQHMVQNMLFSPKEGKQFSDHLEKVRGLINRWIKSDLQSFFSIDASKLAENLSSLPILQFTDGYAISNEAREVIFSSISQLINEIRKCVGITIIPREDAPVDKLKQCVPCNSEDAAEDGEIVDQQTREKKEEITKQGDQDKKFEKVVIISDSRLKSMQPSWSNDSLIIPEIIIKNGLRIRDIIEIAKKNVKLSNLSAGGTLLVLSVGVSDIINFNTHPECNTVHRHEPMIVAVPRMGTEAQISKEILLRMKLLKDELIKLFGQETHIVYSHIIPMDVMHYQNEQKKLHAKSTNHCIIKPMLTNDEALEMTKKIFNIVNSINDSLDKENMTSCLNLPVWNFFNFTSKMYEALMSGSSNSLNFLEDGLNPSRFTKNIMARDILGLCRKYLIDTQKRFEEIQLFEEKYKKKLQLKQSSNASDVVGSSPSANKTKDNASSTKTFSSAPHDRKLESYHDLLSIETKSIKLPPRNVQRKNMKKGKFTKENIYEGNNSFNKRQNIQNRLGPPVPRIHPPESINPQVPISSPHTNIHNNLTENIAAFISYFRHLPQPHLSIYNTNEIDNQKCNNAIVENNSISFSSSSITPATPLNLRKKFKESPNHIGTSDLEDGEISSDNELQGTKSNFVSKTKPVLPVLDNESSCNNDTINSEKEWLGEVASTSTRTDDTAGCDNEDTRSLSKSPSSKQMRTPRNGDKKTVDLKSTLHKMKKEFKEKNKMYRKYPALHSDFEKEKKYFMKKKIKRIDGCLNDHQTYKLEKEWLDYWPSRLDDILHKKWKKKKKHFLKEHGSKSDELDSDSQVGKDTPDKYEKRGEKRCMSSLEEFGNKCKRQESGKYGGSAEVSEIHEHSPIHDSSAAMINPENQESKLVTNKKDFELVNLIEFLKSTSSIIGNLSSLSTLYEKACTSDQNNFECLNESDKKLFRLILESCKSKLKKELVKENDLKVAQEVISKLSHLFTILDDCNMNTKANSESNLSISSLQFNENEDLRNKLSTKNSQYVPVNIISQPYPVLNPNCSHIISPAILRPPMIPPQAIHSMFQNPVRLIRPIQNPLLCNFPNPDPSVFPNFQNAAMLNTCGVIPESFNSIDKMNINQQIKLFSNFYSLDKVIQQELLQFLEKMMKFNPVYSDSLKNLMDKSKV